MRKAIINKRRERGLTQLEASKQLDITRPHYVGIETGKRNPSMILALKIGAFYNLTLEEVLEMEEEKND